MRSNAAFCRNVVGCLYRADVEMYVSACRAPALETCAAFRSACEVQLGRLRDVCGLDVRAHVRVPHRRRKRVDAVEP